MGDEFVAKRKHFPTFQHPILFLSLYWETLTLSTHTHKERERERELGNSIKGHWRKAERRFASLLFLSLLLACKKQRACHQTNIESHPLNVNKSIDDLGLAAALVPAQL